MKALSNQSSPKNFLLEKKKFQKLLRKDNEYFEQ